MAKYRRFLCAYVLLAGLLLVGTWCVAPLQAQCSMCRAQTKSSMASTGEHHRRARAINNGILYLMAIPYLSIGVLAFAWYRYGRRHRGRVLPRQSLGVPTKAGSP